MNKLTDADKSGVLHGLAGFIVAGYLYMRGIEWDFSAIDWEAAFEWVGGIATLLGFTNRRNRAIPAPGQTEPVKKPSHSFTDSGYRFSPRSIKNLQGVNHDLRSMAKVALKRSPFDFIVTSGIRTKEQQQALLDSGKSQTKNSRHLTGHAIDIAVIVEGNVTWDIQYYKAVSDVFKSVGEEYGVPIEWGGDWKGFVDGTHFQLPRSVYP